MVIFTQTDSPVERIWILRLLHVICVYCRQRETLRRDMKGSEIQAAIYLTGYKEDKDYLSIRLVLRLLLRLDPERHKYILI